MKIFQFKNILLGAALSLVALIVVGVRGGGGVADQLADIRLVQGDYQALEIPERLLRNKAPVIILGAPWCPACRFAARDLGRRGVPYFDANIEENLKAADLYRISGSQGIPVILVAGKAYSGYSGEKIEQEWRSSGDIKESVVD
ncbi:MAG: glutaredoxin family protein [bacterium]|nr:glutaredoxin family protein [bacterium]